jgi:hypothetical protein
VSPQQRLFAALLRDTHFFPKKEPGLSLYHITNQSLLYQVFVPFPSWLTTNRYGSECIENKKENDTCYYRLYQAHH